jgi:citrate lyase subunit beta/citryl-CoA lyase
MIPKVETVADVKFVSNMLRMIEQNMGFEKKIGIEVQIETALGLLNLPQIAACDDRIEDLILGPADMCASLGLPTVTAGEPIPGYENLDHFHYVLTHINIAARANNLQAIGGPYLLIRDLDGFRAAAMRERALGYDGKWALHPDQVTVLNEVFAPTQDEYDKAESVLEHYKYVTEVERKGAVMFGKEMIDEASRKMAEQFAARGRAAGMKRAKQVKDFLGDGA